MSSSRPRDPYDGAFFCRHCLVLEVPPRFTNRGLLLDHLADGHGLDAGQVADGKDVVYGWFEALAIREQHEQERERRNDEQAKRFAAELASLEGAQEFLSRCDATS